MRLIYQLISRHDSLMVFLLCICVQLYIRTYAVFRARQLDLETIISSHNILVNFNMALCTVLQVVLTQTRLISKWHN